MPCVICVDVCFSNHENFIQYFKEYIECIMLIWKAVSHTLEPQINFHRRNEYRETNVASPFTWSIFEHGVVRSCKLAAHRPGATSWPTSLGFMYWGVGEESWRRKWWVNLIIFCSVHIWKCKIKKIKTSKNENQGGFCCIICMFRFYFRSASSKEQTDRSQAANASH